MLFLLSPAKALDYDSALPAGLSPSPPAFQTEAAQLIALLRQKTPAEVAALMALSEALAALNVARYAAWSPQPSAAQTRPALLAFNGDVYEGLQARSLSGAELDWAQQHLAILSGLYGVLRPLDAMQPYRLEMGTALAHAGGRNLYQFWGTRIAEHLNRLQAQEPAPVLVNLASQEYFKAVAPKALRARVLECVFQDRKAGGPYKIVSFYAKRARGLMARWAIQTRAQEPAQLQGFDLEGYAFAASESSPERLVFRREKSVP